MLRIQLQTLVCLLILAHGQPAYSTEDNHKKLDRAKHLINCGKPAAARIILREVLRRDPGNADAHMQLGAALASTAENDKYDEAIAEEQKAIQLDPKSSGARRILGMIYANQRQYDKAIALLQQSCDLSPTSFAPQRDLGSAYLSAGKLDEAILAWKKAIEINPGNIAVHSKLATILSEQGKYSEAITEAAQAVKLNESSAEAQLLLANIKLQSGDAAGSVASFKLAIEANGFDSFGCKNPLTAAGALSGLGWALMHSTGDARATLEEAVAYQRKAIKADPRYLPAHVRLAELLEKQNKNKDAEMLYERLFAATKCSSLVGLPYSRFLSNSKRNEEARTVLRKILEKSPKNKQAADALSALDALP
jgi:tetratricopeptide (TPR) repeat protein